MNRSLPRTRTALVAAVVATAGVASTGLETGSAATAKTTKKTTKAKAPSTSTSTASGTTRIEVASKAGQYFVLYVRPSKTTAEIPVSITKATGTTTVLTDRRAQLPATSYRVATFSTSSPGDVDGDGIDDISELNDPTKASPLNPANGLTLDVADGTVNIKDRALFETLSYQGDSVARDSYLAGLEFVKFWIVGTDTDHPSVYFMNTENHRAHPEFGSIVGLSFGRGRATAGTMRGDIVYDPRAKAPDGTLGTYRFAFQPNDAYSFDEIALAYEVLVANMGFLKNNLSYNTLNGPAQSRYVAEKASYAAYRVPVVAIG